MNELASEETLRCAAAPVHEIPGDELRSPQEGIALCLSVGGYRAMLFHLGALWRLNELGHLSRLARISSVSGGSITAGALAKNWSADLRPRLCVRRHDPPLRAGEGDVCTDIRSRRCDEGAQRWRKQHKEDTEGRASCLQR